jgi:dimethylamine/trimethylamine dehydrogenase
LTGNQDYSVLFEPVKIGPKTAPNRFYQVPHCNGFGYVRPRGEAAMRGMKAAGGWGVVATQETEVHPTSDLSPFAEGRNWDDRDIPAMRLMAEAVQDHGSLAAIQLVHNGHHSYNSLTRLPIMGVRDMAGETSYPRQARAMDRDDIRNVRRWHREAALRAKAAGFDIVYVYAGHNMSVAQHFLSPVYNDRSDEYGGSLENRARLLRELLEDTKEAVGDTCAVALRFAVDCVDGGYTADSQGREVVEMLADLPDLWDVNVSNWPRDSVTSRFEPNDGAQLPYIDWVKQVTTKPVIGVGRFTSPDRMVSLVKKGVLDFIGAARPSIADPFLPRKIEEGRIDEIRECIGCNVCVSADSQAVPIRCTQNPTMGEEWRRGWHPERIAPKGDEEAALVIGGGPAGLECAMQLARRGYDVTLAEAAAELGGRARAEAGLSGLGAWHRVVDYRLNDLRQRANVRLFTDSRLGAAEVAELGIPNMFVATGSHWRRNGRGRSHPGGLPIDAAMPVLTPDDIMAGQGPADGPVLIFDDEQGYMGGVVADHLAGQGHQVVLVTPAGVVSPFTELTLELERIQASLITKGVEIIVSHRVDRVSSTGCEIACAYTDRTRHVDCASVVMVTERARNTGVHSELAAQGGLTTLRLIGDAEAPGLIADAVFSGHMAARDFERDPEDVQAEWFKREITQL